MRKIYAATVVNPNLRDYEDWLSLTYDLGSELELTLHKSDYDTTHGFFGPTESATVTSIPAPLLSISLPAKKVPGAMINPTLGNSRFIPAFVHYSFPSANRKQASVHRARHTQI
jgi:hypothetical protein